MSTRSRAAVLVEPRRIEIEEFALPAVERDAALLRVESCGVCGADVIPYNGGDVNGMYERPLILGHEIVGRIERLGSDAGARWGLHEGDRVIVEEPIPCWACSACRAGRYQMCPDARYGGKSTRVAPSLWGGYADYLYVHPHSILHAIPDAIAEETAPLFVPISNGLYWVQDVGGLKSGQTIVIEGPGQHGLGCVVGAKEAGAGLVIVTGRSNDERRFQLARDLGADVTIDIDDEDPVERVRDLTNGEMAHVVVQVAETAPSAVSLSVHLAGDRATIVNVGTVWAPVNEFDADAIVFKELTIKGARGRYETALKGAIALLATKRYPFGQLVSHQFSLESTAEAIQTVAREHGDDALHVSVIP